MICFDIETAAVPDEQLRELIPPLDESEFRVGEFDESAVKLGNLKDPQKIADKITAARAEHERLAATTEQRLAAAREQHWDKHKGEAALSATLGRVLCIGIWSSKNDVFACLDCEKEAEGLGNWWRLWDRWIQEGRTLVGLNICDFDLPFMIRRSWILGVEVPAGVMDPTFRYWHRQVVDLRKVWLCGQYGRDCPSSFKEIARALGTNGKPDGLCGGDFAELWATDRARALEYLEQDVRQPAEWARRMGIR